MSITIDKALPSPQVLQKQQQHVLWKAKVDLVGGPTIQATAILQHLTPPSPNTAPPTAPANGHLRFLRPVSLPSIPPLLLTPACFALYLNAETQDSQQYINGLIHRILPLSTHNPAKEQLVHTGSQAILAHMEVSQGSSDNDDPFAKESIGAVVDWLLPAGANCSYALVYVVWQNMQWQLVLHLLAQPLESVDFGVLSNNHCGENSESNGEENELGVEMDFVRLLARKSNSSEQARMQQRAMSAESFLIHDPIRPQEDSASINIGLRRVAGCNGKMTLTDIEALMRQQSLRSDTPPQPASVLLLEKESEEMEMENKKIAKQLIIAALKERGVGRSHPDFAALWSQIYRSLKFALRDKIGRRGYTPRELQAEANKHADFYCT
ncbi:hypothetical protein BX661DRAFT_185678 [Kickxella alabastrina]|uniref:uncharacterized protein n=1 Tax=Kickxella alabastrina TaxID=61397 RepID=UPI00221F0C64|nr:uncharacterized protein BX661DRAFT_185678 [Kickxella alabastrina]KAI7824183.1 hypothetical protein BX661DRAFT_185678 [Kickxella alabastrina]